MISRASSCACTVGESGARTTIDPPRRSVSRGLTTSNPASSSRPDEQLGLPHRVGADPVDSDLLDDVVARGRRIEGGHVRRAGQEAPRAVRVLELGLEAERPRVRLPADERRLERLGQVGADVEPARARPAAEPLDAPADREVDVQRGHVERDGADRLVGVEHDVRADLVRPLDDRLDVLDAPGLEDHVADRDEQRPLVDRRDDRPPRPGRRRSRRRALAAPAGDSGRTGSSPPRTRSAAARRAGRSTRGRPPRRPSRSGASRSSRAAHRSGARSGRRR